MIQKLPSTEQHILEQIMAQLQPQFAADASGHDWWHLYRVYKLALHLAEQETQVVDAFVVAAAALLHDLEDWKTNNQGETLSQKARELLSSLQASPTKIDLICDIIEHVSYKGSQVPTPMATLEGKIVQDADRLDAIGAIGIARAFAYGGSKGRPMYDPTIPSEQHASFAEYKQSQSATINHFYEKLLLLKDRLQTESARQLAEYRHQYMQEFLDEFYAEWEGEK